jgi:hypothetical protein
MIIYDLIALVVIVGGLVAVSKAFAWARNRHDGNRKSVSQYRRNLIVVEKRVREIARTTTDDTSRLQAEVLADEIADFYDTHTPDNEIKELS